VNALWPRTVIGTAALQIAMHGASADDLRRVRSPQILADAAHAILTRDSRSFSGHFCIDEEVLREEGVTDFGRYRAADVSEEDLLPDFFI
jgi:citronellol/citronellal dehydrogenase